MHKIRRGLAMLLALLLAVGMGGSIAVAAPGTGQQAVDVVGSGMVLEKTVVDPKPLKPGDFVTYSIKVGCSSIENPCIDAKLIDLLPPPLVVTNVAHQGFQQEVGQAISADRSQVELTFNEASVDRPEDKGLIAGADYQITIQAQLPKDVSAELGGTELLNKATLTSTLGEITDDAGVAVEIDPALGAAITKSWAQGSTVAGEETANALTLGGIANTSKVGATSLKITEPSGGSKPFEQVAFTGFGAHTFPEGADKITVDYFIGDVRHEGATGDAPALPPGVDPATVTGFEFIYTSSASTPKLGGIKAQGAAGSLVLNTVVRPGMAAGTVLNQTSIVAETPKGTSKPATAEKNFDIMAVDYKVEASKSFDPPKVVAEKPGFEGLTANKSTVSLGVTNASNQPLASLTLKEPATGVAPFGAGLAFDSFASSPWPANTESIVVRIAGVDYNLVNTDGQITFPTGMPAGTGVTSFTATFNGSYAPNATAGLKFGVIAAPLPADSTGTTIENTVLAGGTSPGGTPAAEDEHTATLTVEAPARNLVGGKSFSKGFDNRVEGIAGERVDAHLSTTVAPGSNADVRQIVQTDVFDSMVPTWKANSVTITNRQGADTVKVEYMDAAGNWQLLDANAGVAAIVLPAGAKGVQVTYQRSQGTFPKGPGVTANIEFELTQAMAGGASFNNVLGINNGNDASANVVADKELKHTVSKSWSPSTIVQKPVRDSTDKTNPASTLKIGAQNKSAYAVDSLKVSEPANGTKPFEYVEITKFSASLGGGASQASARLTLAMADGSTRSFAGIDATTPKPELGIDWANVVGFDFSLVTADGAMVPRDGKFDLTVDTKLRSTLLGSTAPIDEELAKLKPAYVVPNTVSSTVARGQETSPPKTDQAALTVVTNYSVSLAPTLTKTFEPAGPATLFPIKNIDVALNLASGGDKGDKIVVEDVDPTFWNAFDFVAWKDFQSGPQDAKMTYEFFTGGSYSNEAGKLVVTGGEWVKAENLRTNMKSLLDAHNGKSPMTAIEGFRITVEAADHAELSRADNSFKFTVKPRYQLRSGEINSTDGTGHNAGESKNSTVANTATGAVSRLGDEHKAADATAEYTFVPGTVGAGVDKINDAPNGQVSAGATTKYTMTVVNSGTEPILDPKVVDVLPTDGKGPLMSVDPDFAAVVGYTLENAFGAPKTGTTMPTKPELVSATLVDGNKVTFSFPAGTVLYPGEKYTIVLPVMIRAGLAAGTPTTNTVELSGGNVTGTYKDDSSVQVIEGQAYSSMKLVREVPTAGQQAPTGVHNTVNSRACFEFEGGFYRYPCVVETKPGGTAEWKLQVTNTGNVPTNHLEILDVFPYIGDHGVTTTQSSVPRGTKWTPTLLDIAAPALPAGATRAIFYLVGNPASCKPTGDISDGSPWSGCEENWVAERPANPKEIMGLKAVYDFAAPGLAPTEGVSLSFTTQSAAEMPEGSAELAPAWNSFGYYANAQVNNQSDHRSQEPIKSGITFRPVPAEKVSVGDRVWIDEDKDGRQDEDEPGIKDVVLTITGPDGKPVTDVFGNPVLPTMTDGDGQYTFDNLPVLKDGESYTVSIDREASAKPLAPYHPTKPGQGDREGDSSSWTATSEGLTEDGDRDPSLDFGFVLTPGKVSVGDYVWVDTDRDGVQGDPAKEPGIKDVVLSITGPDGKPVTDVFGNEVKPTTTDENGKYTFENLPVLKDGESYTVSIDKEKSKDPLAPYIPTVDTGADRASNSSTWTATSEGLSKDGDRDPTLDFGFVLPKVSVGDFVWVDTDRDGVQGDPAKEPGIKDVVLSITGPDGKPVTDVFGNVVGPVTTDENGKYTFENLPVLKDGESYTVSIDKEASKDPLAPYVPTVDTGADRGMNSSTWTATSEGLGKDGDRDPTLDFGFVLPKVSVGDYVWVDSNRDGLQSEGEKGIKDVVLTITGPDGKSVTDVFGNEVKPTTTDENGQYTFENLPVLKDGESYTVSIDKEKSKGPLAPYIPTVDTGADRASNSSTWTATSEGLSKDGDRDPTLDFGFVLPKVSVGDYVWVDSNRDGLQSEGEKGIKDVVLTITGPDGKPVTDVFGNEVKPTTTDENGQYTFENLPVLKDGESYTVSIDKEASKDPLAPYIPTLSGAGDRGTDSSEWTATSEGLSKDGDRDPTLDFGFVLPKVSVGDFVWVDSNRDGLQSEGEKGIKDVVLTITGPDGKPVTDVFGNVVGPVTTDENGKYTFENLPVLKDGESYTVSIDKEKSKDPLAPYVPTVDTGADRGTNSSTWTATSEGLGKDGDRDPTLDFGFVLPKVSVGDFVWVDSNRDGLQSEGEKGIKDVVLSIAGPDGKPVTDVFGNVVKPTTTDENGKYTFENLPVLKDGESYTVSIDKEASKDPLAPYVPTLSGAGDRGTDSSEWTATSEGLSKDGDRDPTLDFGFVLPKVSVGDFVWVDSNRDGLQSEGEKGIKDVVLTITGPDGKPVTDVFGNVVGPVTTDENGKYTFENLPVLKDGESYTVTIDRKASAKALAPYQPTTAGQGDRTGDSSTWTATSEGLTKDGERDSSLDFGFVLLPEPVVPATPSTPAVPATTAPATDGLSSTGFDGSVLMAMGLLLVLLGGGATVFAARRRRQSPARH